VRVLIWGEVLLRAERGEAPDPKEYQRRFPDLAEALALQFELERGLGGTDAQRRPPDGAVTLADREAAVGAPPELTVPGYEVLTELGRGGMGVVYKARHVALDRVVALKMILSGEYAGAKERERFRAEALTVGRLQHANVVQVFEVGEHQGHPYMALEFVEGGTLAGRLVGPQPPAWSAGLVERLARAVQAAHDRGVVHRDLKPANVLLTADGTPKVADFGLAKRLDAAGATQTGAVVGTPAYMAPEQAGGRTGEVGPPADVWALGAILYECLTGRPPFLATNPTDTILRVLSDDPTPPRKLEPSVPRDLEKIALQCLRKEAPKRYATAGELADDLARFLRGEPVRARRLSLGERLWRRRRRVLAVGLALLVLAVIGLGIHAMVGWRREREDRKFAEAYQLGGSLLAAQKPTEAIASFTEALRLRPSSANALAYRGMGYVQSGKYDLALADSNRSLLLDPENAAGYACRGSVYVQTGRYEEAVADMTAYLERVPKPQALEWQIRATAYLNLRRWPEAEKDLDAAIHIAPRNGFLFHLRSIARAGQGRWEDAVNDEDVRKPGLDSLLFAQAAAALLGGKENEYHEACAGLLRLAVSASGVKPDFSRTPAAARTAAARAFALAQTPRLPPEELLALAEIRPKASRLEDNVYTRRVQVLVWVRAGKAKDAISRLEASLKADPHYSPGINHLLLSFAYKQLGKQKESDLAFRRRRGGHPGQPRP
jgi:tetratricopeptide (TPR) repeat protein